MSIAMRLKAGGVLAAVLVLLGSCVFSAIGVLPADPPAVLGPALAALVAGLTAAKLTTIAGGLAGYVVTWES